MNRLENPAKWWLHKFCSHIRFYISIVRIYSFIFYSLYCVIIFELEVLRLLIFIKFRKQITIIKNEKNAKNRNLKLLDFEIKHFNCSPFRIHCVRGNWDGKWKACIRVLLHQRMLFLYFYQLSDESRAAGTTQCSSIIGRNFIRIV